MKKISILILMAVVLVVSCGGETKISDMKTQKSDSEKAVKTLPDSKDQKTSSQTAKEVQMPKEEPLPNKKAQSIENAPFISSLTVDAKEIKPEIVELPNNLLWSRWKECTEIVESGENVVIRSDQYRHYKGHAHELDLVDKNGFTIKTERFGHSNNPNVSMNLDSFNESESCWVGSDNGDNQTIILGKGDMSEIIKLSGHKRESYAKDNIVAFSVGDRVEAYDVGTRKQILSIQLYGIGGSDNEDEDHLLKIVDYDDSYIYVCSIKDIKTDLISNNIYYLLLEYWKIDMQGKPERISECKIKCTGIFIGFKSDNEFIYSFYSYENDVNVIKINKKSSRLDENAWRFENYTILEYANFYESDSSMLIFKDQMIDLSAMIVYKVDPNFMVGGNTNWLVTSSKNTLFIYDPVTSNFSSKIVFEGDIKPLSSLGSKYIPVWCGNIVYFIDPDLNKMFRFNIPEEFYKSNISKGYSSPETNRTFLFTNLESGGESLMCFGSEQGLSFTVNPTYYWECWPWYDESKGVVYKNLNIKWLDSNSTQASIEFENKELQKNNLTFTLKPGLNTITYPILYKGLSVGANLIINGEKHLIQIQYLACPD